MNDDKKKKYKGIKFLKVEQPVFYNAKKYNRKSSYNSITINNKLSSTDNRKGKKSCKSPIVDNLIKSEEEEKTPNNQKDKINKNYKKLYSMNKANPKKIEELVLLKKTGKKKEEEKKGGIMLISKYSKANLKPLKLLKTISAKNVFSNKNIIINNIIDNEEEKTENQFKSAKIVNNNNKINYNAITNENENNKNICKNSKNISVDKVKKENNEEKRKVKENEKIKEKTNKKDNNSHNFKKFLCCL